MRLYELDYGSFVECPVDLKVEVQKVSFLHPFLKGEKKSMKTFLTRSMFYVLSRGDFSIYYVTEEDRGRPIHTSYVSGPGGKFPFMEKGDIHIGPCYTAPDYRGRGIYRKVLRAIHGDHCSHCKRAYMIVDEENLPSIKGIEAAGLRHTGTVERKGIWKIYRRVSHGGMEKV